MMTRNRIALLLLLLAPLIIYGCTGGASYKSCCVRDRIYDTAAIPQKILDSPTCVLADGSNAANPYGCDKDATEKMGGTARCSPRLCSDITKEDGCLDGCKWDAISGKCNSAQGGDGNSYENFPICTDAIPKNCINNACQAMVCGYSGFRIGPPPTAKDFQNGNPIPSSELGSAAINLQGTSCDFKVMDKKLYNQFRLSQGGLWVNSFRFGVGRSFSDFEQSRYFFPASDRFCSSSLLPGRDRFLVYNNAPDTWCGDLAAGGISQYFACSANSLNFADADSCRKYCFGRTPTSTPQDCMPHSLSTPKNWCRADNFVYNSRDECRRQCAILSDPGACTAGPDVTTKFPFLKNGGTDDGRYVTKLQADYYYGTNTVSEDCGFFSCDGSQEEACKQTSWQGSDTQCLDYNPWVCTGDDYSDDTCLWNDNSGNDDIQGFQWKNSRVFSSQVDTEYYSQRLLAQTIGSAADKKAPFECESSLECFSGSCDTSQYNRVMCKDKNDPAKNIYCGCTLSGGGYSCGTNGDPRDIYRDLHKYIGSVPSVEPSDILFGTGNGNDQTYYIFSIQDPAQFYPFLAGCGIAPTRHDTACLYYKPGPSFPFRSVPVIGYTSDPLGCARFGEVWQYDFHFSGSTDPGKPWGSLGKCKLLAQPASVSAPWLDAHIYGWCQACTSSTLAVQKVTFDPSWQYRYNCLDFRGTYDYSVQNGISGAGGDSFRSVNGVPDVAVSPVTRGGVFAGSRTNDGTIDYDVTDDGYWFPSFGGGTTTQYLCEDQWAGSWHGATVPSQAELVDKMTRYMSGNVMPILDFDQANVPLHVGSQPTFGGFFNIRFKYSTAYRPTDICSTYGADGSAIYAVGDYGSDIKGGAGATGGEIYEGDKVATENPDILNYFRQRGDITSARTLPASSNSISTADTISSRAAVIYKAWTLKKLCPHPPLAAITMRGDEDLSVEIGSKDSAGVFQPGKLHEFFFSPQNPPPGSYNARVAQGTPDRYPDEIDLILSEWHPTCEVPPGANPSPDLKSASEYELSARLNWSRALLSNFSKPNLVWRFDIPQNSKCFEMKNGKKDYSYFLDYIFGKQGDMIDAGTIGLIYDNWVTGDGGAYLASVPDNGIRDGTSAQIATEGVLDSPVSGKTEIFCALQNASRKVLGLDKLTYGQKVLAEKKPGGTLCSPCKDSNGNEISGGICTSSTDPSVINDPDLPQLYCAGGHKCDMPVDTATGSQRTDYGNFFCPGFAVDYDRCSLCSDPANANKQAYCRIEHNDGTIEEKIADYAGLTDLDWNIIAALPNNDKCCLSSPDPNGGSTPVKYTYTERAGVKQKNELLQFPRRGEPEVDCGRPPNTDFLKYCNIQVLNSDTLSYCNAIAS